MQKDRQELELPGSVSTVADLIHHLSANDASFESLQQSANGLLVAVNQTVVDTNYKLSEDDEVAFFPPMTGG